MGGQDFQQREINMNYQKILNPHFTVGVFYFK